MLLIDKCEIILEIEYKILKYWSNTFEEMLLNKGKPKTACISSYQKCLKLIHIGNIA